MKQVLKQLADITGPGFHFTTTADDLMNSECTSCSITQDLSVYWTPPLYFENENGSFTLVPQMGGLTV